MYAWPIVVSILFAGLVASLPAVDDLRAERRADDGRIVLAWTPLAGADNQLIERQMVDGPWTVVATLGGSHATWTDAAVIPGGLHTYRVTSTVAGTAQRSHLAWATAGWAIAADRGVDRFSAVREPDGTLRLLVEHRFHGVSAWRVEIQPSGGAWELAALLPEDGSILRLPAPPPGVFTQIRLRAEAGALVSAWASSWIVDWASAQVGQVNPTLTTADPGIAAPSALALERLGPSNGLLTWQGDASYILRAWGDGLFHHYEAVSGLASLPVAATAWLQQQRFVALGPGGYSNIVTLDPPTLHAGLAPARRCTAEPAAGGGIELTWDHSGLGATGFLIERRGAISGRSEQYGVVAELPASARAWSDPAGNPYVNYRIWAVGSSGLSQPTMPGQPAPTPTPAPANLRSTGASATQVTLAWDAAPVTYVRDYLIERAGPADDFLELAAVSTTTFTDTTVRPGASYRYRVRTLTWDPIPAAASAPLLLVVPLPTAAPPVVASVAASAAAPDQITLTWKPGSGQPSTAIRIRSSPDGSTWSERVVLPGDQRSWSDRDSLTAGSTRHYQIIAENGSGTAAAATVQATTPATAAALTITTTTATVGGHVRLVVRGTAADDDLELRQDGTLARIFRAGEEVATRSGPFAEVRLHGGGGDDRLRIHPSVTWRAGLFADGGSNVLLADGNGPQTVVTLGFGRNTVSGRAGMVTYWLNGPDHDDASAVAAADQAGHRVHRILRFADEVSRELLGQNLAEPGFWANASKTSFPTQPLWGPGPGALDVHQGLLQTCPFTSVFQQVAHSNAGWLQNLLVDLGDGTYAVATDGGARRFDLQLTPGSLSLLPPSGHLWAMLLEKAQYVHRSAFPSWAFRRFETLPTTSGREAGWYLDDGERFARWARRALDSGRSIGVFSLLRGEADFASGCPGQHAHSVLGVQRTADGSPRFVVRNPYGRFFEMGTGFADPAHGLRLLRYADLVAWFHPPSVLTTSDAAPLPPEALDLAATVAAGGSVLLALDGDDVDGYAMTFSIVQAPQRGTLIGTAPDLIYLPDGAHAGSDHLTYTITTANGVSQPALVTITITGEAGRRIAIDTGSVATQVVLNPGDGGTAAHDSPAVFDDLDPQQAYRFGFLSAPSAAQ
jgi:hypothetical protein